MTFWETVERGEYIMIALAVIFILIVCIWIICSTRLTRQNKSYTIFMQKVRDFVVEGDIENATGVCESENTPGAKIVAAGLKNIGRPMTELSLAMHNVGETEKEGLDSGVRWLRLLAVVSPLLGVGGTLVGIIDRLRDLGDSDILVDLSILSAEIAPTLVTTVAGLGVGIFSLVAATFLESTISSTKNGLDRLSNEFTDLLKEPS